MSLELAPFPEEGVFRERMIELLDSSRDCFLRSCFPSHSTGSALVISADRHRALLHHHRKLDRWLQFGGHCDGDEDVYRVAQREAREESGIADLAAGGMQPFDLDIHEIPARGNEPVHFHFDVRYVLSAPENAQFIVSQESRELRWFKMEEMLDLPLDEGMRRLIAKWRKLTG